MAIREFDSRTYEMNCLEMSEDEKIYHTHSTLHMRCYEIAHVWSVYKTILAFKSPHKL
ncbi:hypothetical protein BDY19DRAFT_954410 [Irpex rosettiformis]|uniref:Uncharacterized protein n=1 Tax=Irpex rosettiformis TaxID=378272 RepID=A0ACB8TZW0_9APHY|nr:hypothetical protein BDY19DRAFT_954410 [Irpex rosettiformis]